MFGFFKKLKDGFYKMRKFINYNIKKAKPILEKVDLNDDALSAANSVGDKLNKFKNKAIEFGDDIINIDDALQNKDYVKALEYAGHKFIPRLKLL